MNTNQLANLTIGETITHRATGRRATVATQPQLTRKGHRVMVTCNQKRIAVTTKNVEDWTLG